MEMARVDRSIAGGNDRQTPSLPGSQIMAAPLLTYRESASQYRSATIMLARTIADQKTQALKLQVLVYLSKLCRTRPSLSEEGLSFAIMIRLVLCFREIILCKNDEWRLRLKSTESISQLDDVSNPCTKHKIRVGDQVSCYVLDFSKASQAAQKAAKSKFGALAGPSTRRSVSRSF